MKRYYASYYSDGRFHALYYIHRKHQFYGKIGNCFIPNDFGIDPTKDETTYRISEKVAKQMCPNLFPS